MIERSQPSSSQLSNVSSTSSLPSLASRPSSSSISDLVVEQEGAASLALQQQQQQQPISSSTPTNSQEMLMSSSSSVSTSSATAALHKQHSTSPFKSFRSLQPSGPFSPFLRRGGAIQSSLHVIVSISLACLYSTTLSAAHKTNNNFLRRKLEDEANNWTGEWNGEWTAANNDDIVYECDGDDCNDDDSSRNSGSSMWLDDGDRSALTPDQIITYVSVGILSFMVLLCCCCYPEILVMAYGKFCGRCPGAAGASNKSAVEGDGDDEGGDYVGGRQDDGGSGKKKKKKRRSSSNSPRTDVELV